MAKASVSQLLKIAKRRMEESLRDKEEAIRKELGISQTENQRIQQEATARVKATIEKDLKKLNLKFLQAINAEIKAHPGLRPHSEQLEYGRYGNLFYSTREDKWDDSFSKRVEVLRDSFHKAYEELELALALADTPAALKAQFEAFLKLIS